MKNPIVQSLLSIILAALLLFYISAGLQEATQANAQAEHLRIIQTLLPGSSTFVVEPYSGEDVSIQSVHKGENGFVVETVTRGYADEIVMLIGVSKDGKVTGLVIKDMHETIGLGANALTDWEFLAQFLNTSGGVAIRTPDADAFSGATSTVTSKTETYVDGITGATVTSKAIARCVNSAVGYVTGTDAESSATSWGG